NVNPTSILVPPPQQQAFLRGLFVGSGITLTGGTFSALFFNSNVYQPGQNISTGTLPAGVQTTPLTEGHQVGLTSSNVDYVSPVYSAFTDFGTPAGGGIPAQPGLSGVQGLNGELLINNGVFPAANTPTPDLFPAISTDFRRFEDIAFDQYGYFSQGVPVTAG